MGIWTPADPGIPGVWAVAPRSGAFAALYLSGSGVPADALGNLGDRYYDTTAQRWYLKRWVGNFSGTAPYDNIFLNKPIIGGGTAWALSFLFKATVGGNYQRLFGTSQTVTYGNTQITQSGTTAGIAIGSMNYGDEVTSANRFDGVWHSVSATYNGSSAYSITVDGVTVSAARKYAAIVATKFYAGNSDLDPSFVGQMCKIYGTGYGNTLKWNVNEGSGTVINDASGNGNNGTLSDGSPTTFWIQAWVPMDLLA